jgi:hypothetical protein
MMASLIMSARTRQSMLQSKIQSSPQLHTMYATKENYARSHGEAVSEEAALALGAAALGGILMN